MIADKKADSLSVLIPNILDLFVSVFLSGLKVEYRASLCHVQSNRFRRSTLIKGPMASRPQSQPAHRADNVQ